MDYTKQQFERWFKDHYPMMYRLAFSLVEDAEDARDAVHQVFTEMWHRQPQLDEKAVAAGGHQEPMPAHATQAEGAARGGKGVPAER